MSILARTTQEEAQLKQTCTGVAKKEFNVSHFMIDKCRAELYAIKQGTPLHSVKRGGLFNASSVFGSDARREGYLARGVE